jgi:SAM-dependent methyltransferase
MDIAPLDGRATAHAGAEALARTPGEPDLAVVWHELECGSYRIDLPLWLELAELAPRDGASSTRILDVGAGSGRVALELADAGHAVTALDRDPALLAALRARATGVGVQVETVCADARELTLERRDFDLCLVPMQTIQLLGGAAGRIAFMRRARAHLRHGALLACAIVTELDSFDCAAGDHGPSADTMRRGDRLYSSRPTRVHVDEHTIRIERERRVLTGERAPATALPDPEHDVIKLDRLSARQLEDEARQCGLRSAGERLIPATYEHVGSEVVILRA